MLAANGLNCTLQYPHWHAKYVFIRRKHELFRFQHAQCFQHEFFNYWSSSYDPVWIDTAPLSILRDQSYAIFACNDIDFARFDFSIVSRPYRVTSKQCWGILRRIEVKRGWNDALQDFQALAEETGRNRTGQHSALVVPINRVSKEAESRFGFRLNIENCDTTRRGHGGKYDIFDVPIFFSPIDFRVGGIHSFIYPFAENAPCAHWSTIFPRAREK